MMIGLANSWFPTAVYSLCFLTSTICAWLLLRSYARVGNRILFWTGLCFICLAINNLIVILDMYVILDRDLGVQRLVPSVAGVSVLIYGFVWRKDEA